MKTIMIVWFMSGGMWSPSPITKADENQLGMSVPSFVFEDRDTCENLKNEVKERIRSLQKSSGHLHAPVLVKCHSPKDSASRYATS